MGESSVKKGPFSIAAVRLLEGNFYKNRIEHAKNRTKNRGDMDMGDSINAGTPKSSISNDGIFP